MYRTLVIDKKQVREINTNCITDFRIFIHQEFLEIWRGWVLSLLNQTVLILYLTSELLDLSTWYPFVNLIPLVCYILNVVDSNNTYVSSRDDNTYHRTTSGVILYTHACMLCQSKLKSYLLPIKHNTWSISTSDLINLS